MSRIIFLRLTAVYSHLNLKICRKSFGALERQKCKTADKIRRKTQKTIQAADRKIETCVAKIRQGKYPKNGLHFYDRIAGLLGQRLWFYGKTKDYSDRLKISDACTGCGLCARLCPMENMELKNGRAVSQNRCTMCYRCISLCPTRAITLLGDTVIEQCRYDRYVNVKDAPCNHGTNK